MSFNDQNKVTNYLKRLQVDRLPADNPEAFLQELHLRHSFIIPFENLSIILGHTPSLGYKDLFQKIVCNKRGGYCYELNGLLYYTLKELAFDVSLLSARILFGAQGIFARGHKLLLVQLAGEKWLVDVGYRNGLLSPLALVPGLVQQQFSETFRTNEFNGLFVLQKLINSAWTDLYSFTLDEQLPVDFEPHNFYNACSPDSIFTRMRIVSLKTEVGSISLLNNVLVEMRRGERIEIPVGSAEEYKQHLQRIFHLALSDEEVDRLYSYQFQQATV